MNFPDDIKYEIVKKMDGPQLLETYIYNCVLKKFITLDVIRIVQFRGFPRLKVAVHSDSRNNWPKNFGILRELYGKCDNRRLFKDKSFDLEVIKLFSGDNLVRGDFVSISWGNPSIYKQFIYNGFYLILLEGVYSCLPEEFRILENDTPFDYWRNTSFKPNIDIGNLLILREGKRSYFIRDQKKYYIDQYYGDLLISDGNESIIVRAK